MASEAGPGEGATLGGHEILFQLKAGGMGEVLLARKRGPSGFERLVAIKTMRSELRGQDPLRRMFLDEAQLLARLGHPGIAQIFDFGEDRGVLYLAMEYVAGVRFRDLVALSPPPLVAARAMAEVCRALHAAHEQSDLTGRPLGVVHRDVSPDNLMLTWGGQIKVLDFGIALMRGRQAPVTELGTIKGKPPYLSPEQLKNQSIDRRTDVFAAGAVLHEMLTGAQLFDGDSVYAIVHAIEFAEVGPPSRRAGPLPPGLDEAIMRALDRDPGRRWQTADELARALDRIVVAGGGESLADYAARQLRDEERRHRDWLRGILDRADARPDRAGRPSGVITAAAAFDPVASTLDLPGGAADRRAPRSEVAPGRAEVIDRAGRPEVIDRAGGAGVMDRAGGAEVIDRALRAEVMDRAVADGGSVHGRAGRRSAIALAAGLAVVAAGVSLWLASGRADQAPQPVALAAPAPREPGGEPRESSEQAPRIAAPPGSPPGAASADASAPESTLEQAPASPDGGVRAARVEPPAASRSTGSRSGSRPRSRTGARPRSARVAPAPEPASTGPAGPAAPIGTGTITVVTRAGAPWAQVFIDGEYVDDTPVMKRSISAGDHLVVLKHAGTKQERHRRRVRVEPGQHVDVVEE